VRKTGYETKFKTVDLNLMKPFLQIFIQLGLKIIRDMVMYNKFKLFGKKY
jgi:hypothetical protein